MDNAEERAAGFVSAIEQAIPDADELSCFGDEELVIVGGYVPLNEYDTVLELADSHGAKEAAPYVVEGTNEMHISFDIEGAA